MALDSQIKMVLLSLRTEVNAGLSYVRNNELLLSVKAGRLFSACVFIMEAVGVRPPNTLMSSLPGLGYPLVLDSRFPELSLLLGCMDLTC